MKVLIVNHGYPERYNAGSEIYSQNLTRELASRNIEVSVFTREENPFISEFSSRIEFDFVNDVKIPVFLINLARLKNRYQSDAVDKKFASQLKKWSPDVVHFNHLNHLSLGIIKQAKNFGCKIIFTLHDFWLACPRGQFLQTNYNTEGSWQLCDGPGDEKCAKHCFSQFFTGIDTQDTKDLEYWTDWIATRRLQVEKIVQMVDYFLAPSPSLMARMMHELKVPDSNITLLDYGFNLDRLVNCNSIDSEVIRFGYIGTHTVGKGINLLLKAFRNLSGTAILKIWGRYKGDTTPYLYELQSSLNFPERLSIKWLPEYKNDEIVDVVFNEVDVIVVPSIWDENSPLVIHEAQQCRIPVITANAGGMADYVKHNVNGLLFKHRDASSLASQLQSMIDNPMKISELGKQGYLFSKNGDIPSLSTHVDKVLEVYRNLLDKKMK